MSQLRSTWTYFLGSIVAFVGLIGLLAFDPSGWLGGRSPRSNDPIVVFCAAGLKPAVEPAARAYEEQYGIPIHLQYGPSNTLLATLQVSDRADLFIPADESYVQTARELGLLREVLPLAKMHPVVAVPKGNPKQIRSLDDLLSRDLTVAQANPEAAAVGKVARQALLASGKWDKLESKSIVTKPTVTDVATDVVLGAVDAGIVWDVTVRAIAGLETIPAPELEKTAASLSACVLSPRRDTTGALRFARFLAARDRGLEYFSQAGFSVVEGDRWAETPNLNLLAGAMLRPAIEETLREFEEREGCTITRIYNGCGILVSQMRTHSDKTDAFFACDQEFMTQVHDLFEQPETISSNQLVILVHKGNPHKIRSLRDLGKPGLRVGTGHEKQCAMGVLTQRTLKEDQSDERVMKNVKVQSPTGDMLVNQMLTGSLDAVIAYVSNAAGHSDRLEAIAIDIPCAFANQPYAPSKQTDYPYLTRRLLDAIRSSQSRRRFEAYGFTWKSTSSKASGKP